MTAIEHSILVFLCQAIEAAPSKAADLCSLACDGKERSEEFVKAVQDLKDVSNDPVAVLEAAHKTRFALL